MKIVSMSLEGLVERFFAVADVRRKVITPSLIVQQQMYLRVGRRVLVQTHQASSLLSAGPLELFRLLKVTNLFEPGRIAVDFAAVPIVLVKRIESLGNFDPDCSLLSRF